MFIFIYFSVVITKLVHPNIQQCDHETDEYYQPNFDFIQEYEEEYKPIRIMIDYSNLKKDQQIIKEYLLSAVEFIESTYSVKRSRNLNEIKQIQSCNDLQVPNEHQKNGVNGYDIIIYVGQYYEKQNTMASSKACLFNTQKRAIVATMKFNIRYFEQKKKQSNSQKLGWLGIVVHEISHSLGFSKSTFERFDLLNKKHGKLYIHSHKLMEWGRQYFNCPQLEMLPLEDDGGAGTAGSHWERLTFGDEAMTGTEVTVFYYSEFTMLALEATGLYKANLNRASSNYSWGKNAGCDAVKGSCHSSIVCNQPHSSTFCSADHLKIQYCRRHQVLSECRLPHSIKDCRWEDNKHCFNQKDDHADCYRSECVDGRIRVYLDGQWAFCEDIDNLHCPSPKDFCGVQHCNARGNYVDGKCYCDIGFRGENCDQFVL